MKRIIIALLLSIAIIPNTSAQKKEKMSREDRYYETYLPKLIEGNKLFKPEDNCIIERLDAEQFNLEDNNIKFNIVLDGTTLSMRIYNKSDQEMICRWERSLFVINDQSYNIFYLIPSRVDYYSINLAPRYIAPHSFNKYGNLKPNGAYIYQKSKIKKYGPAFVRLLIPIVVNGKEEMYDFKYKISIADKKKNKK